MDDLLSEFLTETNESLSELDGDIVRFIDFDDAGLGWFMYDVATALSFMEDREDLVEVISAWVEGYRTVAELNDVGCTGTIDVLGEDIENADQVAAALELYRTALDSLQRENDNERLKRWILRYLGVSGLDCT